MKYDSRKEWQRIVEQCRTNIEATDHCLDDIVIIMMHEYCNWLQVKIADNYHSMDIALSRTLHRDTHAATRNLTIMQQLAKETYDE